MISLYGILISLAILIDVLIAESLTKKKDLLWGAAFWGIISGLIGARFYHILSFPHYYLQNPGEIIAYWHGGLAIWGAIGGGTLGLAIYFRKHHENLWPWLDLAAVVVPLGQAIGRWGNYFNREIYGPPTSLPWGILINGQKYHPLFLYESLLDLFLFLLLYYLYKKYRDELKSGIFFFSYLGGYALIRFSLEFLRTGDWTILGLNVAQTISILLLITTIYALYFLGPWRVRTKK